MPKPYTPNDKWSRKAAEEGYRARSVYKLQELDERFRLIKSGMTVLDLGAAPGSWLQYAAEKCGKKGRCIGIDLQEIESIEGVTTYVDDITDIESLNKIFVQEDCTHFNLILSDLAPKTSGIKDVDQWRSIELSQEVIAIAEQYLSPKGRLVIKVFRGADFDEFLADCKKNWDARVVTVKASRDRSREVYVVLSKNK